MHGPFSLQASPPGIFLRASVWLTVTILPIIPLTVVSLSILMYFVADEAKSATGDGKARPLRDKSKKALRKRP